MSDAIIVPGRGIGPDGTLGADPLARVRKAVELYDNKEAPKIIMSGGYSIHLKEPPRITEAQAMKEYAVTLGCDSNDIIEESRSMYTLGNAYFSKKLFCEPKSWHDLLVVTSEDHLPRVEYLFKKVFGPTYTFRFVVSDRVIDDEHYERQMNHERESLVKSEKTFADIADGDDEGIRKVILELNPEDSMANL